VRPDEARGGGLGKAAKTVCFNNEKTRSNQFNNCVRYFRRTIIRANAISIAAAISIPRLLTRYGKRINC
jgi:hypothetical protein